MVRRYRPMGRSSFLRARGLVWNLHVYSVYVRHS